MLSSMGTATDLLVVTKHEPQYVLIQNRLLAPHTWVTSNKSSLSHLQRANIPQFNAHAQHSLPLIAKTFVAIYTRLQLVVSYYNIIMLNVTGLFAWVLQFTPDQSLQTTKESISDLQIQLTSIMMTMTTVNLNQKSCRAQTDPYGKASYMSVCSLQLLCACADCLVWVVKLL